MQTKVTRRQLAATLAGAAGAHAAAHAQTATPPLPKNPDEELQAAREDCRSNAEQLAKVELAMTTEPAFHFKA